MAHMFEAGRGFFVREPSWHRFERAVIPEHVTDWKTARKEAALDWDVFPDPVYVRDGQVATELEEFYAVRRTDTRAALAVQPSTYALISLQEFGEVIEAVAGEGVKYEALFSLYGGKHVIALLYFEEPLSIPGDPSKTFTFVSFDNRFDGQGGLRGIPTNVRVQCANTLNLAEMTDGRTVGFTIRHTANWDQRVAQAAEIIQGARRDAAAWQTLAQHLSARRATPDDRERFLKRFMPTATDMTDRMVDNVNASRAQWRALIEGPSNEGIADTAYGLVMASTEWSDHIRRHHHADSYVSRQLLRKEEPKARAVRLACQQFNVDRKSVLASVMEPA